MRFIFIFFIFYSQISLAAPKLVLVTIDGLRWQEVFQGADAKLIEHKNYVAKPEVLKADFWRDTPAARRNVLMPFFWQHIVKQGVVLGNRDIGSNMSVANPWYFSYPGYSEILTGVVDESIDDNSKTNNPQVTFLEWLNNQSTYHNKVAAFGSWDVFPYIFNVERSKLPVNAGFSPASGYLLSNEMHLLNALQKEIPSPWATVRLDAFTHRFAKDYLIKVKPEVMVIAYGETDDFAHDGKYDQYLYSAKRTDNFIADLWQTLQSLPEYKDNTVLLLTTDHGRGGEPENWKHHASKRSLTGYMKSLSHFSEGIIGSNHTWFAAIGPNISAKGQIKTNKEIKQKQIAATALTLMGLNPKTFNVNAGMPITEVLNHD